MFLQLLRILQTHLLYSSCLISLSIPFNKYYFFCWAPVQKPTPRIEWKCLEGFLCGCSLKGARPDTFRKSLLRRAGCEAKAVTFENCGFPRKWHPAAGSHASVTRGTLLPGELCCCQESDLQRDGKNAEVLFCLHKQLTS